LPNCEKKLCQILTYIRFFSLEKKTFGLITFASISVSG